MRSQWSCRRIRAAFSRINARTTRQRHARSPGESCGGHLLTPSLFRNTASKIGSVMMNTKSGFVRSAQEWGRSRRDCLGRPRTEFPRIAALVSTLAARSVCNFEIPPATRVTDMAGGREAIANTRPPGVQKGIPQSPPHTRPASGTRRASLPPFEARKVARFRAPPVKVVVYVLRRKYCSAWRITVSPTDH